MNKIVYYRCISCRNSSVHQGIKTGPSLGREGALCHLDNRIMSMTHLNYKSHENNAPQTRGGKEESNKYVGKLRKKLRRPET